MRGSDPDQNQEKDFHSFVFVSALMSHSNNENNTAAVDRPTVKVKPDHILKKPPAESKSSSTAIRESDLRRIRILTGSGGRKMAVRDRSRRLTNGETAAASRSVSQQPPAVLPPLTHAPPQPRLSSQRHQVTLPRCWDTGYRNFHHGQCVTYFLSKIAGKELVHPSQ